MNLDEFFAVTTAVTRDTKTQPCEDIDHSFLLNTDSAGNSCLHASDVDELVDERQMQGVPQMSAEACDEQAELGGRMDDRRNANADGIANGLTVRKSSANGRGKDNTYWDRRVKNNIAAKRSRDAKRMKEVNVVERWKFLEEENKQLKKQIANMKERTSELEKKLLHQTEK